MNGKWALSVKDEGMVGLSDAFCPTWHNQGLFLKYAPQCYSRPIFVDIGCGIFGPSCTNAAYGACVAVWLVMQITSMSKVTRHTNAVLFLTLVDLVH